MKLQYRDRWPSHIEADAHQKTYGGPHKNNYRNLWMVRIVWPDGGVSPPTVNELLPDEKAGPWVQAEDGIEPVSKYPSVQCAPIDADGNAAEWPT